jgi:hypothetical protein
MARDLSVRNHEHPARAVDSIPDRLQDINICDGVNLSGREIDLA